MNKMEEKLSEQLNDEFSSQDPPSRKNILKENVNNIDIETGYVVSFFEGKKWNDVTLNELMQSYKGDPSACLVLMGSKAYRYYLPSFLRLCLVEYDNLDMVYETTLWRLIPSKNNISEKEFDNIYSDYNLNQKVLIAKILQYLSTSHKEDFVDINDAQNALDEYWGKYLVH